MGNIKAEVLSVSKGRQAFEGLDLVRIQSDRFTLLIMQDYMPVIGEIRGRVELQRGDETTVYDKVRGFFTHSHNNFSLLLKEDWHVQ